MSGNPTGRTRHRILEMSMKATSDIASAVAALTGDFSGTITFYTSSTSGGATDVLNTVTITNGLVSWTQGSGVAGGTGESIGLLLALTYA